jgi:hypothetical protein
MYSTLFNKLQVNNIQSFVIHDVPATNFPPPMCHHQGRYQQMNANTAQIVSKCCICRVKMQYYQL